VARVSHNDGYRKTFEVQSSLPGGIRCVASLLVGTLYQEIPIRVRVMVFNVTFNNISAISWRSVLWMEETMMLYRGQALEYHIN
jgi:hypothetical protein